ncbi:glycosyltransferase [Candidatus Woesearchaeota archaeon]|nr:glycosyltransferase [Candidatus Woesearchaeota archaeon]
MKGDNEQSFIAYMSTFPSRKCGIATFTQDLTIAMDKLANPKLKSKVIALNDNGNSYDYSDEVIYQINDGDEKEYVRTAQEINNNDKIKMVNVQHEFKIFGSDHGENLLMFLKTLKKPAITTFHTVLPHPSNERKNIVQSIAQHSKHIVVMSNLAVEILKEQYGLNDSKIVLIPHGIHDVPYEKNTDLKKKLGYSDRIILTSFGFLRPGRKEGRSSGRGYEYIIDALPGIVKQFPNVLYLVIGVTHPKTLKVEGEKYRESLKDKVKELGLENNVKFINEYLALNELFSYLKSSDIYICSSLNNSQMTSGTLVYAMGCGCAVISTPFLHANEIVTPKTGILLDDFRDSNLIAKAVINILSNPDLKGELGKNAYDYTRDMIWNKVAISYLKLFNEGLT